MMSILFDRLENDLSVTGNKCTVSFCISIVIESLLELYRDSIDCAVFRVQCITSRLDGST